jgi:hypothetical protein
MSDIPTFPASFHADPASVAKALGGGDALSLLFTHNIRMISISMLNVSIFYTYY